jgi:hypothetical protein
MILEPLPITLDIIAVILPLNYTTCADKGQNENWLPWLDSFRTFLAEAA